jgi:hypothetical protein
MPRFGIDVDAARCIDAAGGVEAVALAGVEVVRSVGGRGVDGAGALVGSDVGGQHAEDAAVEERVLECGALEQAAFEAGEFFRFAEVAGSDYAGGQFRGDDIDGAWLRFVLSHPCRRRKRQGWGTLGCGMASVAGGIRGEGYILKIRMKRDYANDAGRVHGVVVQMMV